jgi:hypothetical protein
VVPVDIGGAVNLPISSTPPAEWRAPPPLIVIDFREEEEKEEEKWEAMKALAAAEAARATERAWQERADQAVAEALEAALHEADSANSIERTVAAAATRIQAVFRGHQVRQTRRRRVRQEDAAAWAALEQVASDHLVAANLQEELDAAGGLERPATVHPRDIGLGLAWVQQVVVDTDALFRKAYAAEAEGAEVVRRRMQSRLAALPTPPVQPAPEAPKPVQKMPTWQKVLMGAALGLGVTLVAATIIAILCVAWPATIGLAVGGAMTALGLGIASALGFSVSATVGLAVGSAVAGVAAAFGTTVIGAGIGRIAAGCRAKKAAPPAGTPAPVGTGADDSASVLPVESVPSTPRDSSALDGVGVVRPVLRQRSTATSAPLPAPSSFVEVPVQVQEPSHSVSELR